MFVRLHPRLSQQLSKIQLHFIKKTCVKIGRTPVTYSLLMEAKMAWSKTVICSAISRADKVSMFSRLGICGNHWEIIQTISRPLISKLLLPQVELARG